MRSRATVNAGTDQMEVLDVGAQQGLVGESGPERVPDGEWREKLWSGLKSVCEEREASVPGLRAG